MRVVRRHGDPRRRAASVRILRVAAGAAREGERVMTVQVLIVAAVVVAAFCIVAAGH
jgi:hypothetical protein